MNEKKYEIIYKKLIGRFVITSLLLFIVFFFKQFVIHYQLVQEQNTSYIINISGRQRMLSQKIVKDVALIHINQPNSNYELYKNDLENSLDLWKDSHNELLEFSEQKGFLEKENIEINQMLQDIELILFDIIEGAEGFIEEIEKGAPDINRLNQYFSSIFEKEDTYLNQMNSIVSIYDDEAREKLDFIKITNTILFLFMIAILIFFTYKVFIPLINYLKNAVSNANKSNKNLIKIFQTMKGALFVVKKDGEIIFMNDDAGKIVYKALETNEGRYLDTSVKWIGFDIQNLISKLQNDDTRIENIDTTIEDRNGNLISVIMSAISGNYNGHEAIILNLFDITVQKKVEESLKDIATKDKLTGLYNRYFLESIISSKFEKSQRYEIPFSGAMLDLDHFKNVNDKWGHPVGDSVLQFTADIITNNIRNSDFAIRAGGEEFLILMPNTDFKGAAAAAEKIRKAIENAVHPTIGKFTASFGVAERNFNEEYQSLYNRIDEALYKAKDSGRNCVVISKKLVSQYVTIPFKWNERWNCGEGNIDAQHRELFEMVIQLANVSYSVDQKQHFIKSFNKIINNIVFHFQYEEKVLFQIKYEEADYHKKTHAKLLKKARKLKTGFERDSIDYSEVLVFMLDQLVIGHILSEDIKFYPYFEKVRSYF